MNQTVDFVNRSTPNRFKTSLSLWHSVWHQAGSLPEKSRQITAQRKIAAQQKSLRHPFLWSLSAGSAGTTGIVVETKKQAAGRGVKKVKRESDRSRRHSVDGDAPVLCQSLFPGWYVFPLSRENIWCISVNWIKKESKYIKTCQNVS